MKHDKLEKFILDNRDEFDVYEPREDLWDRIQQPAPKVIKLNWKTIAIRVAAVIVIFIASYYFHDFMQKDNPNNLVVQQEEIKEEENENVKELMEAEVYYSSQINTAREQIFQLSGSNQELIDEIDLDMQELENIFGELKNDLKDNSDNEEVIEAMIQNYRIKLEVLTEILSQLQKSNKSVENENVRHEI
ncbi:MAG: hypothetical protein R2764_07360 [Bacteroidales bacterium]